MDIHNVQRTGKMHYVYLPTSWCKKHTLSSESKISIEMNSDGSITLYPQVLEKKQKSIKLKLSETDPEIIYKLIVAAYVNPASSFRIDLSKEINVASILDQKKLISVELVEISGKSITCESSLSVHDPEALMSTMVSKVRNMLLIMVDNYNLELVQRYEEEIDRSKLLIDKAIIGYFTYYEKYKLEPIILYYISLISKELERIVDKLITLSTIDKPFLKEILICIEHLKEIFQKKVLINQDLALLFTKKALSLKHAAVKDITSYDKSTIKEHLINISEVLIDWSITRELLR